MEIARSQKQQYSKNRRLQYSTLRTKQSGQKFSKEREDLNNIINKVEFMNICTTFHSDHREHTFSIAHGIFTKTDQTLSYKKTSINFTKEQYYKQPSPIIKQLNQKLLIKTKFIHFCQAKKIDICNPSTISEYN